MTNQSSTIPHLSIDDVDIPLEVAQHVLWHFGDQGLGVQPGSFTTLLLRAASHADQSNRARLLLGFPEYVAAWRLVSNTLDGLQSLRLFVQEATRTSGDHCLLRRERVGRAIAVHYDCDDYVDGTKTDVLSGEVIR